MTGSLIVEDNVEERTVRRQAAVVLDIAQRVELVQEETPAGLSETAYAMTLPAASYGVFGEGE